MLGGFCLLVASCQNDGGQPVTSDTLIHRDTLAARDPDKSIGLSLDSLIIDTTAVADGVVNNDTAALMPGRDVITGKTKPGDLVAFAKTLKGVPYVYASSNPKVGFDCSGFITYVFNRFGIAVPRSSIEFTNVGKAITPEQAKPGDLILLPVPIRWKSLSGIWALLLKTAIRSGLSIPLRVRPWV